MYIIMLFYLYLSFIYRVLNNLQIRCSVSGMFAHDNANSCSCNSRKCLYSLKCNVEFYINPILQNLVTSDLYCLLQGNGLSCCILFNLSASFTY